MSTYSPSSHTSSGASSYDLDLQLPDNVRLGGAGPYYAGSRIYSGYTQACAPTTDAINIWAIGVGAPWPHPLESNQRNKALGADTNSLDGTPTLVTGTYTASDEDLDEVMTFLDSDAVGGDLASPTKGSFYSNTPFLMPDYPVSHEGNYQRDVGGNGEQCISPVMLHKNTCGDNTGPHDTFFDSNHEEQDKVSNGDIESFPRKRHIASPLQSFALSASSASQYHSYPSVDPPETQRTLGDHFPQSTSPIWYTSPLELNQQSTPNRYHAKKEIKDKEQNASKRLSKNGGRSRLEAPISKKRRREEEPEEPEKCSKKIRKHTASQARHFKCILAFAGCHQDFSNKNEWKRHVESQHLQTKAWMCDDDTCQSRKAIFNRKDLFGQHLKRMHGPPRCTYENGEEEGGSSKTPKERMTEEYEEYVRSIIPEIQNRCFKIRRYPPERSRCMFCEEEFVGKDSWELKMEHVGRHYEASVGKLRGRRKGKGAIDKAKAVELPEEKMDELFVDWALREGIIEEVDFEGRNREMVEWKAKSGEECGDMRGVDVWSMLTLKKYKLVLIPCDPLCDALPHGLSDSVCEGFEGNEEDDGIDEILT